MKTMQCKSIFCIFCHSQSETGWWKLPRFKIAATFGVVSRLKMVYSVLESNFMGIEEGIFIKYLSWILSNWNTVHQLYIKMQNPICSWMFQMCFCVLDLVKMHHPSIHPSTHPSVFCEKSKMVNSLSLPPQRIIRFQRKPGPRGEDWTKTYKYIWK